MEIRHIEPALNEINAGSDLDGNGNSSPQDGATFTAEVIATMMPDGNTSGDDPRYQRAQPGARGDAGAKLAAIVESSDDAIIGKRRLAALSPRGTAGAEQMFGYAAGGDRWPNPHPRC